MDGGHSVVTGVEVVCPICYEEFCDSRLGGSHHKKRQRIRIDECGHEFCLECLSSHLKIQITENRIPIPCPEMNCAGNDDDDPHHCLSPDFVSSILCPPPVSSRAERRTKTEGHIETAFKVQTPIVEPEQDEIEATPIDLEKGYPPIQLNRTFSTQSASSMGSSTKSAASISFSSSSSSCLSIASLPGYWSKYLRFQRLKEDPTLLSCPACGELVPAPIKAEVVQSDVNCISNENSTTIDQPQPSAAEMDGSENPSSKSLEIGAANDDNGPLGNPNQQPSTLVYPQVSCPACQHCFCAIHGDAHQGMTCIEFAQTQRGQDLDENERLVLAMTKKCSHDCGARLVLVSGCDHVICSNCHQDMCWKCGTHVFLSGKVIRSCSNCKQGFVDHRYYNQYRVRLLFTLPFHLILSAIYFAFIAVVMVVTCSFGCCFGCGTRGWNFEREGGGKIRPKKGLSMTAQVVCLPMIELIRDCGFWPHNDAEDHD